MFNVYMYWTSLSLSVSVSPSVYVCYQGSVSDWELSGWRAASSVDSVDKSNVKKMRAGADWTERVLAIKGEMKTNGHMIGQGDGTK